MHLFFRRKSIFIVSIDKAAGSQTKICYANALAKLFKLKQNEGYMTEFSKNAVVFGGTGFMGTLLVRALAKKGYHVIVPSRYPKSAYRLKPCGRVGQICPIHTDFSAESIKNIIPENCDLVVNLIGILTEKKRGDFHCIHAEIPKRIAQACTDLKVASFVHVSALSADQAQSNYAKSKYAGEQAVTDAFKSSVILRPSLVFGPDDDFFNKFARLSVILPFLPLIGGGHTKFQPVYVGDVIDAILSAATKHSNAKKSFIYELGGPEILSFKEIYERIAKHTGRKKALLPLPWSLAYVQATFMSLLPKPLLTRDQVTSLKTDNIVQGKAKTLKDLGLDATALDAVLPLYLSHYRVGGRFAEQNKA
jgi:NADH dehydrogenase